jgi:hypothetical protein
MRGQLKMNFLDGDNSKYILNLTEYRRSPSPGAEASRPKYHITTPEGEIYFKFQLTNNEICAEIVAYQLAESLNIPVAKTFLSKYKENTGIASYDIGVYEEPDDSLSYSLKDFLEIDGFIQMCLFDYLIMNEDRHAGNWGILDKKVTPLFDHNQCFGGDAANYGYFDTDHFMVAVTSAFYVEDESQHRHDDILKYLLKYNPSEVKHFTDKLDKLPELKNFLLEELYSEDFKRVKELYEKRIDYMKKKVGEISGR